MPITAAVCRRRFASVVNRSTRAASYILLALACAYIGWKQRHHRLTTDSVIDMEPTPRFPKEETHLWHMKEAANRGRPS